MKRAEQRIEDTWDLSDLYDSLEAWEAAFLEVKALAKTFKAYSGRLYESAEILYEAIQAKEHAERTLSNVMTYARLKHDEDTKNAVYQSLATRVEALASEYGEMTAFYAPELMAGEYAKIEAFVEQYAPLAVYRYYFESLFRSKPHIRSEEIEHLLAQTEEMASGASNAYGMLLNADMTFEDAIDSEGNAHPITNGSYIPLMMREDRELRKDAFTKYYANYKAHINTFAALLQTEVKKNIFYAKARGFKSAREAALFDNHIPVTVPDALIEAVHGKLDHFYEYMKLRKDVLGYDALHLYDIYNPIVESVDFKVTYDEAQKMTLGALKPLGEAYGAVVEDAYKSRWIDVYENEGKRSGAYSWGTYDSRPYILLNHKDNVDSMFTLIHEMGHSMHSYLTHQTQPFVYGHYSIFLAEVASTTNEALLNDHLMKTIKDEGRKKYIVNHYLEQFRGTIFRQTMFAEFERDIHATVEAGGALTAEYLCSHYLELNRKYFGPDVVIDDAIQYEWARIPHFYYDFYVYQYATGFSAAIALSDRIINEGETAVTAYLDFLKSGASDSPIPILRRAGADMETEVPVGEALNRFAEVVNAFGELVKNA
ncbi:MAG: oligoendopeptidase [Clostridiales bacterium]|nr:oligoendopeptidase [Clostridiales bacterium]